MLRKRLLPLLAAAALAAGSATWAIAAAAPASACFTDTDGDCVNSAYGYWHIQNTDSSGLLMHSSPDINSPTHGGLPNGTGVEVICQTNGTGDPYDGDPEDSDGDGMQYNVWDKLDNGYYIYDGYFVSSPGDGFHIVLNHC